MKKINNIISQLIMTTNFEALRIAFKGDCSSHEIKDALRRQDEIKQYLNEKHTTDYHLR